MRAGQEHKQRIFLPCLNSKVKYRIVEVTKTGVSVNANSAAWVFVDLPSPGTVIAIVGWYFTGGGAYPYSLRLQDTGASIALRNVTSSATGSQSLTLQYLVVD